MKIHTLPSVLRPEVVPYASVEIVRESATHTLQVHLGPTGVIDVAIVPVTPAAPVTPVVEVALVPKGGGR